MSEPLDLFELSAEPSPVPVAPEPMTLEQRTEIRSLFAALGTATAREQFELVNVLIGVRLRSVTELNSKNAAGLIPRLQKRVESLAKTSTGNSWADREEDTWIDNL